MIKRPVFIVVMAILALVGGYIYFEFRTPPGVEPMGESTEMIAWLGLATSVVGLLTAIVGLAKTIIDRK